MKGTTMNVVKSKTLIPMVTEEDIKNKKGTLYWPKPERFVKMISVEDENNNSLKFEEIEEEIKIEVNEIGPITVFYEEEDEPILSMLESICKGGNK